MASQRQRKTDHRKTRLNIAPLSALLGEGLFRVIRRVCVVVRRRRGGPVVFVRIPSGSRSRRDECPPSWGIVAIELETRTCFAGGQGFGFEACGWLPQASDGESMRHQRELDVSPNGWARRLRPTGAVTLPAQTGR